MGLVIRPCAMLLTAGTLIAGMALAPASRDTPLAQAAQPVTAKLRPDAAERVDSFFAAQERAHIYSGTVLVAHTHGTGSPARAPINGLPAGHVGLLLDLQPDGG